MPNAVAPGARPRFAQGCRRRSRACDRIARRDLYQRALALGEGEPGSIARRAKPLGLPNDPRPARVAAFRLGLSAESRAAILLIAKGYRIVARRWKTPLGEIDIVARRRRTLVFVEVKARERADDAAEAVTERTNGGSSPPPNSGSRITRTMCSATSASTSFWWLPASMPQHIANAFDASR